MPLFIDQLPFHRWTDPTRVPPLTYWTVVLPVVLTEPTLQAPPAIVGLQEWALDTGNRGEAFAWRHHLLQAGLDPDQRRMPASMTVRSVTGRLTVPVRDADLWLVSNVSALASIPFRISLHRGLPFHDVTTLPDPEFQRPLIGIRALRSAGLRIEIDFANDTISVWTPDVAVP
jgi:hypothetical protein